MKILITGATGYVGRTLIPHLYRRGLNDICITVRNPKKADELFHNLSLEVIDISSGHFKEQIIAFAPDVVLHMATLFSTKHDAEIALKMIYSNISFGTLLLEAIAQTGCKHFVNVGTFTEFLWGNGDYFSNNLYSATKTAFRPIIQYYQLVSAFKWINVVIYSPYGRKNEQKKVIDYLVDSLATSVPIKMTKGEQILDFIHVDDIADFFYALFTNIDVCTEPYIQLHLGSGKGYSIREVGAVIETVFDEKLNVDWGGIPYRKLDPMFAVAPISKVLDLLNWRPKLTLEEGIEILKNDLRL